MAVRKKIDFAAIGVKVVGLGLGSAGGEIAATKLLPKANDTIKGFGQIGLGVGLPLLVPNMDFLEHVGDGMIANGAVTLGRKFAPKIFAAPAVTGVGQAEDTAFVIDEDFEEVGEMDPMMPDNPQVVAGNGEAEKPNLLA